MTLQFGQSIAETLKWNTGLGRFEFSDDVGVSGDLEVTGTMSGKSLQVTGTGAAPLIYADQTTGRVGIGTAEPENKLTVTEPTTADALADVMIGTSATTQKGLVIQGKASQSANLFEVQDSTGTPISYVQANGNAKLGKGVSVEGHDSSPRLWGADSFALTGPRSDSFLASGMLFKNFAQNGVRDGLVGIDLLGTTTTKGLSIRGGVGQTVNLQEWQNSNGTALAVVDASGNVGIGTTAPETKLEVTGTASGNYIFGQRGLGASGALVVAPRPGTGTGNTLIVDTKGLVYDATNKRVGIGTESPNAALDVTGNITSPGLGSQSEKFGYGAVANGDRSIAIGYLSTTNTSEDSLAIGHGAVTSGNLSTAIGRASAAAANGTAFGYNANAGSNDTAIGTNAAASNVLSLALGSESIASGERATALGQSAHATALGSIAIGQGSVSNAANTLVIGADDSTEAITSAYFGKGIVSGTPADFTLNGTGGAGENVAGANVVLAGGKATGNAAGGALTFSTSDAGSSGTALQTLSEKMRISANGNVGIGTAAPETKLEVTGTASGNYVFGQQGLGASGAVVIKKLAGTGTGNIFIVDTKGLVYDATNKRVGIGTASPLQNLQIGTNAADVSATPATISLGGTYSPTAGANAKLRLFDNGAGTVYGIGVSANQFDFITPTNSDFVWHMAGAENMRMVRESGNVGIGTTAPETKLEVTGTASGNYIFGQRGLGASGALVVAPRPGTGTGNTLIVDTKGLVYDATNKRVGIGTESPNAALDVTGNITSPGLGSQSEKFGYGAVANGDRSIAIGYLSTTNTSEDSLAIGHGAVTSGNLSTAIGRASAAAANGTAFGYNANAGSNDTAIGTNAAASNVLSLALGSESIASGERATALGQSAHATALGSIAIGQGSVSNAANTLVIGADDSTEAITSAYFGKGIVSGTPADFTLNGTGGAGENVAGANVVLAGGKATGNAAGGALTFSTSDAGSSGTALQTLSEKMRISANGNVGIGTAAPETKLEVTGTASGNYVFGQQGLGASGAVVIKKLAGTGTGNIFIVDTKGLVYDATNKRVGIGTASPGAPLNVVGKTIIDGGSSPYYLEFWDGGGMQAKIQGWSNWASAFQLYGNNSNIANYTISSAGDVSQNFLSTKQMIFNSIEGNGIPHVSNILVLDGTTGNVGIGTTAPETKLEVVGSMSGRTLQVTGTGAVPLFFADQTTGRVGVGTASPAELLHVSGNANFGPALSTAPTMPQGSDFSNGRYVTLRSNAVNEDVGMLMRRSADDLLGLDMWVSTSGGDTYIDHLWPTVTSGLHFRTNAANGYTPKEVMFLNSAGNVGIGTTSPGGAGGNVEIKFANSAINRGVGTPAQLFIGDTATSQTADSGGRIDLGGYEAGLGYRYTWGGIKGAAEAASGAEGYLSLFTQGSDSGLYERMRIDSTGNVGIGTTAPETKLEVTGTASGNYVFGQQGLGASGAVVIRKLAGTGTGNIFIVDTKGLVYDATNKRVGIGTTSPGEKLTIEKASGGGGVYTNFIKMQVDGNASSDYFIRRYGSDGVLDFYGTQAPYSSFSFTTSVGEALRILNNGNVGIGTASPENKLEVAGSMSGRTLQVTGTGAAPLITTVGGNVGIGTATPTHDLNVVGDVSVSGSLIVNESDMVRDIYLPIIPSFGYQANTNPATVTLLNGDSYIVSASSQFSTDYPARNPLLYYTDANAWGGETGYLFQEPDAYSEWATLGETANYWLQIQLPRAVAAQKVAVMGRSNTEDPQTWKLQGSNNGSTWTDLLTGQPAMDSATPQAYTFSNTVKYSYYRIFVTDSAPGTLNAGMQLFQLWTKI
jgi:hypothetical protein